MPNDISDELCERARAKNVNPQPKSRRIIHP